MIKEYEAKALLNYDEFIKLKSALIEKKIRTIKQENIYIDTIDNFYKNNNSALRIRKKNNTNELTLKIKTTDGNEEYNTFITDDQVESLLTGENKLLEVLNYPLIHATGQINTFTIITTRETFIENNIEFELDETLFLHTTDYEIEVEADSLQNAEKYLFQILKKFNITYKESMPKIQRYHLYNKKILT